MSHLSSRDKNTLKLCLNKKSNKKDMAEIAITQLKLMSLVLALTYTAI